MIYHRIVSGLNVADGLVWPPMELVNGVPCYSCADVAKAKAGLATPDQAAALAALREPVLAPPELRGVNQPLAGGARGTVLNIVV